MSTPIPENKVKPEYLNIHLYIIEFIYILSNTTRYLFPSLTGAKERC